jgi:hypothetical protein
MNERPQHLETRLRHLRQQRNAEIATKMMKWLFWLAVAVVAISRLCPK